MCERKRSPRGKVLLNNENWIPRGQSVCLLLAKFKVPNRHEKLWPKPLVQWLQIMNLISKFIIIALVSNKNELSKYLKWKHAFWVFLNGKPHSSV